MMQPEGNTHPQQPPRTGGGQGRRSRKSIHAQAADGARDALRDPESERGRAVLVALLDYVAFMLTLGEHGADLAAEIVKATGRTLKRARGDTGRDWLPDELESHARALWVPLLCLTNGKYRELSERFPGRGDKEAREARAYLARFTGRASEEGPTPPRRAPDVEARLSELRDRLKRLDEEDDQIIRCTERFKIEKEIYDLENAPGDPDEWPEYIDDRRAS